MKSNDQAGRPPNNHLRACYERCGEREGSFPFQGPTSHCTKFLQLPGDNIGLLRTCFSPKVSSSDLKLSSTSSCYKNMHARPHSDIKAARRLQKKQLNFQPPDAEGH